MRWGAPKAGIDERLVSLLDRVRTQAISMKIWDHPQVQMTDAAAGSEETIFILRVVGIPSTKSLTKFVPLKALHLLPLSPNVDSFYTRILYLFIQ